MRQRRQCEFNASRPENGEHIFQSISLSISDFAVGFPRKHQSRDKIDFTTGSCDNIALQNASHARRPTVDVAPYSDGVERLATRHQRNHSRTLHARNGRLRPNKLRDGLDLRNDRNATNFGCIVSSVKWPYRCSFKEHTAHWTICTRKQRCCHYSALQSSVKCCKSLYSNERLGASSNFLFFGFAAGPCRGISYSANG